MASTKQGLWVVMHFGALVRVHGQLYTANKSVSVAGNIAWVHWCNIRLDSHVRRTGRPKKGAAV